MESLNTIMSFVGAVFSALSIFAAIYFFLKQTDNKRDKARHGIVKILLSQLHDDNMVNHFEIQSVINSKCREHKIGEESIGVRQIVEDLLCEIISNPLLSKENKSIFAKNLKEIIWPETESKYENSPTISVINISENMSTVDLYRDKSRKLSYLYSMSVMTIVSVASLIVFFVFISGRSTFDMDSFPTITLMFATFSAAMSGAFAMLMSFYLRAKRYSNDRIIEKKSILTHTDGRDD